MLLDREEALDAAGSQLFGSSCLDLGVVRELPVLDLVLLKPRAVSCLEPREAIVLELLLVVDVGRALSDPLLKIGLLIATTSQSRS